MLPAKLTHELSEIRLDVVASNQGKLRLGLALTVVTIVVTASGWPPGDAVQRAIFFVLAVGPSAAVGVGLVVGELIYARATRRGLQSADAREVQALRAAIAAELGRGHPTPEPEILVFSTASRRETHTGQAGAPPRSAPRYPPRRLVTRSRSRAPFRSGILRLR